MSTGAATPTLIRGLQERAAHALPVISLHRLDGWWLRHADLGAWWASSVLPHTDAVPPGGISAAERFYAQHGAPTRFQISPGACPAQLDEALAERGYRIDCPMSLQTVRTAQVIERLPADGAGTRVDPQPTDAWLATWLAVHGGGDPRPERDMLRRVSQPSGYASVSIGDAVVAVGRAVAEDGWAGVFGMGTVPHARGTGAARRVLAGLAHWAGRQGAGRLYLQVECANIRARRLYGRAGFAELCRYHYRVGPQDSSTGSSSSSSVRNGDSASTSSIQRSVKLSSSAGAR